MSQAIAISPERVERETQVLIKSGFVCSSVSGDSQIGHLSLAEPAGVRWAAAGFPPIGSFGNLSVAVAVNLRLDFNAVLQDIRTSDVDQSLKDDFEIRLRRLEEELVKPEGVGSFEKVRDVVDTANNSRQLLESVIPLLAKHWDKIQALSDAAGSIIPG